jgi:hypothetical protein
MQTMEPNIPKVAPVNIFLCPQRPPRRSRDDCAQLLPCAGQPIVGDIPIDHDAELSAGRQLGQLRVTNGHQERWN